MRYMGSKARHAKHIVPILMKNHDQTKPYIEPFVGGGNMIDKVPADIRWGSDVAEYAIALLDAVSKGWTPPETLSYQQYHDIKGNPDQYESALVGFAAYSCSYGGKFWGGFARSAGRDYGNEQYRAMIGRGDKMKGVLFHVSTYQNLSIPNGSTVYCDPPYMGTTKYKSGDFDHNAFWVWAAQLSGRCRVFVSEYSAPPNWLPVWEKETASSLTKDTGGKRGVEKLFTIKSSTTPPE